MEISSEAQERFIQLVRSGKKVDAEAINTGRIGGGENAVSTANLRDTYEIRLSRFRKRGEENAEFEHFVASLRSMETPEVLMWHIHCPPKVYFFLTDMETNNILAHLVLPLRESDSVPTGT